MRSEQLSAVRLVLMLSAGLDAARAGQEEATSSVSPPKRVTTCVDNPLYRSRMGLKCSQHANMDCEGLLNVGFMHDQIEELVNECPVSCRAPRCVVGQNHHQDDSHHEDATASSNTKATVALHTTSLLPLEISANRVLQTSDSDPNACYPGWDPTCQDDATYSRFGASCSSFAGLDCNFFLFAGWLQSEVNQLIVSCPCSCRVECPSPTFMRTTSLPTSTPTVAYSDSPSVHVTETPTTAMPTALPSSMPTSHPTMMLSNSPSESSSSSPSISASSRPSSTPKVGESPSSVPTITFSTLPSSIPTISPSIAPTDAPTLADSAAPSLLPSSPPTISKSQLPSTSPTIHHSSSPSSYPSAEPTVRHSQMPSSNPSIIPTTTPSAPPSASPSTHLPSEHPTFEHSEMPSALPSIVSTPQRLGINPPITDRISQGEAQDASSSEAGNGTSIAVSVGCALIALVALIIGYTIHRRRRRDHSRTSTERSSASAASIRPSATDKSTAAARIIASCQSKASSTSETKRQREERKAGVASQTPSEQRAAWKRSMFVETQHSSEGDDASVEGESAPAEDGAAWIRSMLFEKQPQAKGDDVSVAASETAEATAAAAETQPARELTTVVEGAQPPTVREQDGVSVASSATAKSILQELDALSRSIVSSRSSPSRGTGVTSRSKTTGVSSWARTEDNGGGCTVAHGGFLETCFCFGEEPDVDTLYDVRSGTNDLTLGDTRSERDDYDYREYEYDYDDEGRDDVSDFEEIRREEEAMRMHLEKVRQRRKRVDTRMPLDVVAIPSPSNDSVLGNENDGARDDSGADPLDDAIMMSTTISGLTTLNG